MGVALGTATGVVGSVVLAQAQALAMARRTRSTHDGVVTTMRPETEWLVRNLKACPCAQLTVFPPTVHCTKLSLRM